MFDYFKVFYIDMRFGPSYIGTNILLLVGAVLIFNRFERSRGGLVSFLKKFFPYYLVSIVLSSVYYAVVGSAQLDTVVFVIMLLLAVWRFAVYEPMLRVVRGIVYYACYFQILAVSEPLGLWLKSVFGEDKTWLDNSTWIMVFILLIATVVMINHWSVESMVYVPKGTTALIIFFSVIGIVLQGTARYLVISRIYKLIVGVSFYVLQLVTYYLFFLISVESKKNMEYMAIAHKEELDRELVQATRDNMEQLHIIRHEIKNHMAYIRVLIAQEEYGKLFDYTNHVLGENEQVLNTQISGNSVVDAVVTHATTKAGQQGIMLESQIIVPEKLPFEETDFCSILSNLTNNAIEAASKSGEENPVIKLQILPKQDYLFIHVTNPVSTKYSKARVLSLKTTKANTALHGYGTKVIAKLVEKYDGSVQYDLKDRTFVADVMLDMMGDS